MWTRIAGGAIAASASCNLLDLRQGQGHGFGSIPFTKGIKNHTLYTQVQTHTDRITCYHYIQFTGIEQLGLLTLGLRGQCAVCQSALQAGSCLDLLFQSKDRTALKSHNTVSSLYLSKVSI